MASSPAEALLFLRSVPRSLRNREPILEGAEAGCNGGGLRGIVSTLVDADTSVGVDIWLGLIRFRTEPDAVNPSCRLVCDGLFFNAIIAASVFLWTSRASDALSSSVCGSLEVDGLLGSGD